MWNRIHDVEPGIDAHTKSSRASNEKKNEEEEERSIERKDYKFMTLERKAKNFF